jgi:hypothetical protein
LGSGEVSEISKRQKTAEDKERFGRHAQKDFHDAPLRFLEKQSPASSWEINRTLCSPKTIVLRVFHDLDLRFFARRCIPYRLSEAQKDDRFHLSQAMLEMMESLGPKQRNYFITGDDSWVCRDNQCCGMWAKDTDFVPANSQHIILSKKTMLCAYFSRCRSANDILCKGAVISGYVRWSQHLLQHTLTQSLTHSNLSFPPFAKTTSQF